MVIQYFDIPKQFICLTLATRLKVLHIKNLQMIKIKSNKVYTTFLLILFFCPVVQSIAQPQLDSLFENPAIQEINRMPMRTNYFPYENETLANAADTAHSTRYLSLNGMWRFHWVNKPELLAKDFFAIN